MKDSRPDEPAAAGETNLPAVIAGADSAEPIVLAAPSAGADPGFTGSVTAMSAVIPDAPAEADSAEPDVTKTDGTEPATGPGDISVPPPSTIPVIPASALPEAADPEEEPVFAAARGWEPLGSPSDGNGRGNVSGSRNGTAAPARAPGTEAEYRSARRDREQGPEPAAALTADRLLVKPAAEPVGGWRLWLYRASFGYINLGDSDRVRIQRAMEHRISARLGQRTRYVPVLSRKGGVGKTTVTTLLGMALADLREDRVIAMDANPDRGTLSDRSPGRADFTARQLVNDRFAVSSFSQLSHYVAREGSRLDVLASDTDPAVAHAFDDADYRAVTDILGRYYSIVLTDSGTGMVHSVMTGTLEKADAVVLVSGGSVDEARLASETLSWLEAHGRHDLVAKAIVVINMSGGEGTQVNIDEIEDHFRSRVRNVLRIPYDRHLAEGSRVRLDQLRTATRDAIIELAALVVDELQAA
ncbi:MAG: hypothetical protein M3017_10865 [Actinomycetota bacterium]|nr:hypothetical protein [Actinomycetota bacterium]